MEQQFKYFAFISYNSKDTAWGKKLQKKLEHYRMPATLCSEHGWKRTPISPIFFAPTDIQPGGLSNELQERLCASAAPHCDLFAQFGQIRMGRQRNRVLPQPRTHQQHTFLHRGRLAPQRQSRDRVLQSRHRQTWPARNPRRQYPREDLSLAVAQQGTRIRATDFKVDRCGV